VRKFHETFGLTINEKPTIPSGKDAALRVNLINEEAKEFEEATNAKDIVKVADALADLLYVVYGAALTYGLDMEPIFREVQRSNMSKIWDDGTVHKRESDGKILKPTTYSPADISKVIEILRGQAMVKHVKSAGKIDVIGQA
jgi:predicted HAD superfamily Cof-like phosphohydrolase